jgi:hypothetical protein
MRLSCQKVPLLVLASIIACTDSTGPRTVSAHFVLQSIDGRALPTYLAATPGPSTTIVSSTLTLDLSGNAVFTEHRDDMNIGERTYTSATTYTVNGSQIEIAGQACLTYPDCIGQRVGTIFNNRLNLTINPRMDFQIVYEYRAAANP